MGRTEIASEVPSLLQFDLVASLFLSVQHQVVLCLWGSVQPLFSCTEMFSVQPKPLRVHSRLALLCLPSPQGPCTH